jgi:4-amino-4-deoxy-L-arabinose transferase-like glycosyltransferase
LALKNGISDGGLPGASERSAALPALRALALAVVVLVVCARLMHLSFPLERDEGEYAYIGQLMLRGIPPFTLASSMKIPGTAAVYALGMALFGQTAAGIHFLLLLVNLATAAAVFRLARRLFGEVAAWASVPCFMLLSLGISVQATSANAEHFVLLPALLASLLLLRYRERPDRRTLALSGLLFGLAVIMKQAGGAFAVFGALYLLWLQRTELRARPLSALYDLGVFAAAGLAPLALVCLALWRAGVFAHFWFWTVSYALAYIAEIPVALADYQLLGGLLRAAQDNVPFWLLGLSGLELIWTRGQPRAPALWTAAFSAFSLLAVSPGLYCRPHYYIYLLPAAAILGGAAIAILDRDVPRRAAAALFFAVLACSAAPLLGKFYRQDDAQLSRLMHPQNPFVEAETVGAWLREHSGPEDRIAVIGSEPEIYFYARRLSATDHIYAYPLVEQQPYAAQMRDEFDHDVTQALPAYIVTVNLFNSWLVKGGFAQTAGRLSGWLGRNYELAGVADPGAWDKTVYIWGSGAGRYTLRSPGIIGIYRRKTQGTSSAN